MINEDPSKYLNKVYSSVKLTLAAEPEVPPRRRLYPRLAVGALVWMLLYSLYQWAH